MHQVARGVGPVNGMPVRAKGQAVGGYGVFSLGGDHRRAAVAAVQRIQRGVAFLPGLIDGAHPEAPQRVALAVVGAHVGRVVIEGGNVLQRAAPGRRTKNAVAQGQYQAALGRRCHAARLAGHVPTLHRAHKDIGALNFFARNVDPVKHLLQRMPKR